MINNTTFSFATSEETIKFIDHLVSLLVRDFQSDWFKIDREYMYNELDDIITESRSIFALKLREMGVESSYSCGFPAALENPRFKKQSGDICYISIGREKGKYLVSVGNKDFMLRLNDIEF